MDPALAAHNENVIRSAIEEKLAQIYATPEHNNTFEAKLGRIRHVEERRHMAENGNGLLLANARMDRIEHSIETLTAEIPKVVDLIQRVSEKVDRRFDESIVRADNKAEALLAVAKPDFAKYSGTISILVTVALVGIGGFAGYVKSNLETDLTRLERNEDKTLVLINQMTDKIREEFIPRQELDLRFTKNEAAVARVRDDKVDRDVLSQVKIRYEESLAGLRSDVERLKNDIVSRRENETHWDDEKNRINLLSERVNIIAKESGGASLSEQLKSVKDELSALQSKFIMIPQTTMTK